MYGNNPDFTELERYKTPAPTIHNDPANVLAGLFIHIFTIICMGSDICSDVFQLIFALAVGAGGIFIATLPVTTRYPGQEKKVARGGMIVCWIASADLGLYAAKQQYNHYIRYDYDYDSVDKFNAFAKSTFGGATVTTLLTAGSAAIVHIATPKITYLYNKALNAIPNTLYVENEDIRYNQLEEGQIQNNIHTPMLS